MRAGVSRLPLLTAFPGLLRLRADSRRVEGPPTMTYGTVYANALTSDDAVKLAHDLLAATTQAAARAADAGSDSDLIAAACYVREGLRLTMLAACDVLYCAPNRHRGDTPKLLAAKLRTKDWIPKSTFHDLEAVRLETNRIAHCIIGAESLAVVELGRATLATMLAAFAELTAVGGAA
jgi:hypothetical protein